MGGEGEGEGGAEGEGSLGTSGGQAQVLCGQAVPCTPRAQCSSAHQPQQPRRLTESAGLPGPHSTLLKRSRGHLSS